MTVREIKPAPTPALMQMDSEGSFLFCSKMCPCQTCPEMYDRYQKFAQNFQIPPHCIPAHGVLQLLH